MTGHACSHSARKTQLSVCEGSTQRAEPAGSPRRERPHPGRWWPAALLTTGSKGSKRSGAEGLGDQLNHESVFAVRAGNKFSGIQKRFCCVQDIVA